MAALTGAALAFVLTPLAAAAAERLGVVDAARGAEAERKRQRRAVPPVGGLAIALAWLAAGGAGIGGELPAWFASPTSVAAALLFALALGTVDDLRAGGLAPATKLAGQLACGLALAAPVWTALDPGAAAGWSALAALGAAVSCNVWNTFDNADGAAAGLAGCGLAVLGLPAGGALLGFLPWNLALRRAGEPRAYLGDAGSHLIGVALLAEPAAWALAALPALDLLRVAVLRVAAGDPPWRGDRRHLAHALQRRGLGPLAVAAALVLLGLLALLARP